MLFRRWDSSYAKKMGDNLLYWFDSERFLNVCFVSLGNAVLNWMRMFRMI